MSEDPKGYNPETEGEYAEKANSFRSAMDAPRALGSMTESEYADIVRQLGKPLDPRRGEAKTADQIAADRGVYYEAPQAASGPGKGFAQAAANWVEQEREKMRARRRDRRKARKARRKAEKRVARGLPPVSDFDIWAAGPRDTPPPGAVWQGPVVFSAQTVQEFEEALPDDPKRTEADVARMIEGAKGARFADTLAELEFTKEAIGLLGRQLGQEREARQAAQAHATRLQESVEHLEGDLKGLGLAYDAMKEEADTCRAESVDARSRTYTAEGEARRLERIEKELLARARWLDGDRWNLGLQLASAQKALGEAQERLGNAEAERVGLAIVLDAERGAYADLEIQARQTKAELDTHVTALEKMGDWSKWAQEAARQMREQLSQAVASGSEWHKRAAWAEAEAVGWAADLKKMRAERDRLKGFVEGWQERVVELERRLAGAAQARRGDNQKARRLIREYRQKARRNMAEADAMRLELEEARGWAVDGYGTANALTLARDEAERARDSLAIRTAALDHAVQKGNGWHAKATQLQRDLDHARLDLEDLREKLAQRGQEAVAMGARLADTEQARDEWRKLAETAEADAQRIDTIYWATAAALRDLGREADSLRQSVTLYRGALRFEVGLRRLEKIEARFAAHSSNEASKPG